MASKKETYSFMRFIAILFFMIVLANKAHALGLGMLKVNSNLDQPLDATIDLLLNAGDNVSEIEVVMASQADFDNFGVDYADYIDQINISFDHGDEQSLVQLQSEEIIKEPFLHFLVRVNWPGGSFLREYTALVDPPLYAAENPRSVTTPRVVGEDQSYTLTNDDVVERTETEPEPVYTSESIYESEPEVQEGVDNFADDAVAEEEPLYESDDSDFSDISAAEQSQPSLPVADDARYGPIVSGESLSQIAFELQQQFPELSIYQIMPILLQENPDAFIDNNINGLLEGAILNISSVSKIREYDIAAGKQFFYDQIAEWSSYQGSRAEEVAVTSDSYLDNEEESGIDALFSDTSDNSQGSSDNQEFLVGAGNNYESALSAGDSTDPNAEILALESEIATLEVELQSSSLENQELRERISLLEGQLSDVNRLLSLEDTELSALESTLAEQDQEVSDDSYSALDDLESDSILDEVATDVLDGGVGEEEFDAASVLETLEGDLESTLTDDTLLADNAINDDGSVLGDSDSDANEFELLEDGVEESEILADTTAPASTVSIRENDSFLDKVKAFVVDSQGWRLLAGIGAVILGFIGLIFYRRRRADEEFEISMMTIESHQTDDPETETSLNKSTQNSAGVINEIAVPVTTAQANVSNQGADDNPTEVTIDQQTVEGASKETSFLTVYSDSDAVVQSDEVDPVAEADVYIAYGRDEQAEEVLVSGMDSFPERLDIKHKLLGLHHKNENAEEFERIAETMYADVDNVDPTIWSDICKMGLQLNPDNPIFTATTIPSEIISDSDVNDLEAALSGEDAEGADKEGESFITGAEDSTALEEEVSIDLDQDDIEFSEVEADEIEFESLAGSVEQQADLSDQQSNAGSSKEEDDDVIEFDSLELEDIEDIADSNENSFNETNDAEISGLEFEEDYDEAETQYELAKVFSDLGDNEGAKRILQEIIGDRHNKKEVIEKASSLLETIDS